MSADIKTFFVILLFENVKTGSVLKIAFHILVSTKFLNKQLLIKNTHSYSKLTFWNNSLFYGLKLNILIRL